MCYRCLKIRARINSPVANDTKEDEISIPGEVRRRSIAAGGSSKVTGEERERDLLSVKGDISIEISARDSATRRLLRLTGIPLDTLPFFARSSSLRDPVSHVDVATGERRYGSSDSH